MDAKIADVAWKSDMAFRFSMARIVTRGVILDFAYIFALTMLFCVYVNAMWRVLEVRPERQFWRFLTLINKYVTYFNAFQESL